MKKYHITCINKPHHHSSHEHITHVGNLREKWRFTREDAIFLIDNHKAGFYTIDKTTGKECEVGVIREDGKVPFLRSHADGKPNDNLLEQPECVECKLNDRDDAGLTGHTPKTPVDLRGGGRHG
jgi:hypothetical protein